MTETTALATREDYLDAVERVRSAAGAYYNTDTVAMDDATYDALLRGVAAAELAHPDWKVEDSPAELVGAGADQVAPDKAVRHDTPMLSLGNLFDDEGIDDWLVGRERMLGRPVTAYAVESKFDGLACSAKYENGVLVRIASRGDGTTGEDLTYALDRITNLPRRLTAPFTGEVRGEVEFRTADYEKAGAARVAAGKSPYVNPRNAAAGALRTESLDYPVTLTFFPYGLAGAEGITRHSESLERLVAMGFQAQPPTVCTTPDEVKEAVSAMATARPALGYAIDGAVIKVDLLAEQDELGLGSRAPRWGIAFKYPADTAISTLEEVIWQVGRTGVITPRARITPTLVGGTTIEFATLHNPSDLQKKGFLLGDKVTVLRAGEVIPRLEAPVVSMRTGDETEIEIPEVCPRDGSEIDRSQIRWRCVRGRLCGLVESLQYAVARDALDAEGMGEKIVRALVDADKLNDVADLFTLTREDLLAVERLGESNTDKILAELEKARQQPLSRVLTALGVRMTGRSMSRRLAKHFGTMAALQVASIEELEQVDGVGPGRAATIREELDELAPVIAKLVEAGVTLEEENPAAAAIAAGVELPFTGMTVVISGAVPGLSRNEANEWVERLGGKSSGSVSKTTGTLVTAETTTSKATKAAQLGVPIMDPSEFAELVKKHS